MVIIELVYHAEEKFCSFPIATNCVQIAIYNVHKNDYQIVNWNEEYEKIQSI